MNIGVNLIIRQMNDYLITPSVITINSYWRLVFKTFLTLSSWYTWYLDIMSPRNEIWVLMCLCHNQGFYCRVSTTKKFKSLEVKYTFLNELLKKPLFYNILTTPLLNIELSFGQISRGFWYKNNFHEQVHRGALKYVF